MGFGMIFSFKIPTLSIVIIDKYCDVFLNHDLHNRLFSVSTPAEIYSHDLNWKHHRFGFLKKDDYPFFIKRNRILDKKNHRPSVKRMAKIYM